MGYMSNYSLTILPSELTEEVLEALESQSGYTFESTGLYYQKWYDHNQDCSAVTSKLPCLIILDREGEEFPDVERKVYLNGSIVWQWKLDFQYPKVPPEILSKVDELCEKAKAQKIAELEAQIKRLKES